MVQAIAYEASLRDVAGTTARGIAISLGRLCPNTEPSFATSPRISASRRVSAPGEDAMGIWQMAPTSVGSESAAGSPPVSPRAESSSVSSAADADGATASSPERDSQTGPAMRVPPMSDDELPEENDGQSGELTPQPVDMHSALAQGGACRDVPDVDCMSEAGSDTEAHTGGLARAADACVFVQRVSKGSAVVAALDAEFMGLLGGDDGAPRARTTASSACSQVYGAGNWWKVPVDTEVDVPDDDGFRVGSAEEVPAAGRGGPGRRLRHAARCTAAGVAVIAARMLLRGRRRVH